jgi:hypothetical protein
MCPQLFTKDARYRVRVATPSWEASFVAGEILIFVSAGYSHYDECCMYEFSDESGNVKTWWLPRGDSGEKWRDFFEPA